jgi:hypothetical protein
MLHELILNIVPVTKLAKLDLTQQLTRNEPLV